jgi:hypothetical protein
LGAEYPYRINPDATALDEAQCKPAMSDGHRIVQGS